MQVTSSKWLDRLRESKGFPASKDLDLDQFLTNQNTHKPNSPNSNPSSNQFTNQSNNNGVTEDITNVLYELFDFGELKNTPKKGTRKQEKPRFCVVSNPGFGVGDEENCDVEEKGSCDFVGFSRTQVTVIDTSYPWWKCEKAVFRKKNVWRVKDRKNKSGSVGVRKRKGKNLEDGNGGARKKAEHCGSSNEGIKQNEKMNLDAEENPETFAQVQKQRSRTESIKKGSKVKKTPACKENVMTPNSVAEIDS